MSYYIFKPAIDTPETGSVFPQVQKMRPGYNYQATNSVHALSREVEHLPEYSPDLDYFVVNSKAKLTDLLSVAVAYGGFLISPKLKELLEKFNLPAHKFFPAKVSYKTRMYDYYWVHVICDLTNDVDYMHSTFFIYHNYSQNLGFITVSSKEDLLRKKEKLKKDNPDKTVTIWAEKIFFQPTVINDLDLFQIGLFNSDYYISQKLKEEIINSKILGVSITDANNLFITS
jgi:hypothetical protein